MTTGPSPLPTPRAPGPSEPSPRAASRVVVGADGSDEGWQAVAWGDHLARLLGGDLVVVAAWQVSTGLGLAGGGWAPLPAEWDPVADTTRDLREGTARVLGAERAGRVDLLVVEGHPAQVLVDLGGEATLLVVGSQGHGAVGGMLLGSVSAACVHRAPCPVLVVRASTPPPPVPSGG